MGLIIPIAQEILKKKKEGWRQKHVQQNYLEKNQLKQSNKRGKFGRILGTLHVNKEDGSTQNINQTLVEEGHAVEYSSWLC